MSKPRTKEADNFKEYPFNGERVRWEDFHRYLRMAINKREDLPQTWLNYLFDDYPHDDNDSDKIVYPAEFVTRVVPNPPAANANMNAQRNLNDAIKRDEKHNERVRKSLASLVDILSSCVGQDLRNIFHDDYDINPYRFYVYLKTSFGPESNQNEDKSLAMHKIMTMNMGHNETFTSFMTKFNNRATYLKLKSGAKRGLLTAIYANTGEKIQLLPDRLITELKRVREIDMTYKDMLVWLTQQDINQMNDGLKVLKIKKIQKDEEEQVDKVATMKEKEQMMTDPNGLTIRVKYLCYNCSNYGHSAKDCLAPYCNQCRTLDADHKSNLCPAPKSKKRPSRRKKESEPEQKKGKCSKKIFTKSKANRSLKPITTSSYQTDEDDDESLRQDADSEDHSGDASDDEEDSRTRKRSRSERNARIRTIKYSNESHTFIRATSVRSRGGTLALHDSGAQAHAARNVNLLSEVLEIYDGQHSGGTQLKGASGEDLHASAIGLISGLEAPVIVAKIEDDIIISTAQMSNSNHWTIHPPTGLFPGVGVVVIKHNDVNNYGSLMTIGNEEMYSNSTEWNRSDIRIKIPDLSPIMQLCTELPVNHKSPNWMTGARIQGME